MASVPCRCWRCNTRQTKAKPLGEYVRPPKCKACGKPALFVCKDRLARKHDRKKLCNCSGYHFKHRKGSKWCQKNPNADVVYQEERKYYDRARRMGAL